MAKLLVALWSAKCWLLQASCAVTKAAKRWTTVTLLKVGGGLPSPPPTHTQMAGQHVPRGGQNSDPPAGHCGQYGLQQGECRSSELQLQATQLIQDEMAQRISEKAPCTSSPFISSTVLRPAQKSSEMETGVNKRRGSVLVRRVAMVTADRVSY
ncbi:hypothetical protein SRHO_G00052510 [Serrasalmus rhombeus]